MMVPPYFNLKDVDVKPFFLYAPFSDEQGVFWEGHVFLHASVLQSHPHALTADYSLVPVDAGAYGIPHVFFHPCDQSGYGIFPPMSFPLMTRNPGPVAATMKPREWRPARRERPHVSIPSGFFILRAAVHPFAAITRHVFGCELVGLFQKCHLFLIARLCILCGSRLLQLFHLAFKPPFPGLPAVTRKNCRGSC